MRFHTLCSLLLLLSLLLSACSAPQGEPPAESAGTTEEVAVPAPTVTVAQDKKSLFEIIVDTSNAPAKRFANVLQTAVFQRCGAFIPIRDYSSSTSGFSGRIYVGDPTGLLDADCKAQISPGSYGVFSQQERIDFYAADAAGFVAMEQYLQESLFSELTETGWSVPEEKRISSLPSESFSMRTDAETVYSIVHDGSFEGMFFATLLQSYLSTTYGIASRTVFDGVRYENEILLGNVKREQSEAVSRYSAGKDAFFSGVLNGAYVIYGKSNLALAHGCTRLLDLIGSGSESTAVEIRTEELSCGDLALYPRNEEYAALIKRANDFSKTYCSYQDRQLASASNSVKADQALVEALTERMGNSMALYLGSSSALHKGYIVKLDRADYERVLKITPEGHLLAPADYLGEYFQASLPTDSEGYVDLTAYCASSDSFSLTYFSSTQIAVITPAGEAPFDQLSLKVGNYTNAEYVLRMKQFFTNSRMPEPDCNVEQTRLEIFSTPEENNASYFYDYEWYNDEKWKGAQVLHSPAILARRENGRNVLYAIATVETKGIPYETQMVRSEDEGKTWTHLCAEKSLYFASLFEQGGRIYMIGNYGGAVMIVRYDPTTGLKTSARFSDLKIGGGAPNTVLHANGRIYKAYNDAVISAPEGSDLLERAAWTVSNNCQQMITRQLFQSITGKAAKDSEFDIEEGNPVQTPDGQIYVMYRLNAGTHYGYVALFKLSSDGTTMTLDERTGGIMNFPYTKSKFSLVYEESLGLYISIVSLATMNNTNQRNVLGLVVSEDLYDWEVVSVLLTDRQMLNDTYSMWAHGFQYVDFVISDNKLYFVIREAFGDSYCYHEANASTLYTLENLSEFIAARRTN